MIPEERNRQARRCRDAEQEEHPLLRQGQGIPQLPETEDGAGKQRQAQRSADEKRGEKVRRMPPGKHRIRNKRRDGMRVIERERYEHDIVGAALDVSEIPEYDKGLPQQVKIRQDDDQKPGDGPLPVERDPGHPREMFPGGVEMMHEEDRARRYEENPRGMAEKCER